MKKSLKLRAVVSPTPAIIAAAYDENGKADACTLAFYTVDIGSSTQITGEVVNIQADESILDERGKYSLEKLNPIIYDEEHWRYLSVGEKAADAFKCGLVFKKA